MTDFSSAIIRKSRAMMYLTVVFSGVLLYLNGSGVAASAVLGLPAEEEFRWTGALPAGKTIEIKGVNGGIRAEQASGNQVEVVATKTGRRSDPKSVEIKVVEHAQGVTICSVYPSNNASQPNECQPGSGGRMNTRNNDVKVDFVVRVPSGNRFIGRTVNGGIQVSGLKGDVEGYSVNGGLELSTSGLVQAYTVNGGINATLGSTEWNGKLAFETVNGGIKVELPSATNTDFEAETVNGRISSDFPVTVQGKINPRRLSGTIGNGGRGLVMKTVNGSVELVRVP